MSLLQVQVGKLLGDLICFLAGKEVNIFWGGHSFTFKLLSSQKLSTAQQTFKSQTVGEKKLLFILMMPNRTVERKTCLQAS